MSDTQKIQPPEMMKGARITLKKPAPTFELAQEMFAVVDKNRNHILPWLDWALPEITATPEDSFKFILGAQDNWKSEKNFGYLIHDNVSSAIIGGFGVMHKGERKHAQIEYGYWLSKDNCGKGYVQEAIKLAEPEFWALGIERMVVRNDVDNLASAKTAKSLGYRFEGIARHARWSKPFNAYRDSNIWSKIKGE